MDYDIAYTEDSNFVIRDIVDSGLACAQFAKSIGGALFWSWNPQNQECRPKTTDSGRGASSIGTTSGTVACGSAGGAGKQFFLPKS